MDVGCLKDQLKSPLKFKTRYGEVDLSAPKPEGYTELQIYCRCDKCKLDETK